MGQNEEREPDREERDVLVLFAFQVLSSFLLNMIRTFFEKISIN